MTSQIALSIFWLWHVFQFCKMLHQNKLWKVHRGCLLFLITARGSVVHLLSHVWFFVTPWTAARQASLSVTNSQSLLNLMSIESVTSSNCLIPCRPPLLPPSIFPSIRVFSLVSNELPMSQLLASGGQSIGVSASTSVLPMNIQDWFPLGLIGLISLKSKGLSRVFSNTTSKNHQFFSAQH